MNRRSFLRGLLGATALVPLAKIAATQPTSLYEAFEFTSYETRIPIGMVTMAPTDWAAAYQAIMQNGLVTDLGSTIKRFAALNAP